MPNRRVISTQETALHSTSVRNHTASIRPAKPPTVPPGEALDASIRQDLIARWCGMGRPRRLWGCPHPFVRLEAVTNYDCATGTPLLGDRDSSGMCGER